ncbi:hypothetical protein L208DRAFT_330645 [Tricholoma matsutake]|nr:hypothetical protein L208DRAFT_330645 [Tricholoma matsutake 945]
MTSRMTTIGDDDEDEQGPQDSDNATPIPPSLETRNEGVVFYWHIFPSTAVQPCEPLLTGGLVFLFFNLFFSISISISFFYFFFILLHHGCEQLLAACKCN